MTEKSKTALVVIDMQNGFDDLSFWGPTTNPDAEANVTRLLALWAESRLGPVVIVRHDSDNKASPLFPGKPSSQLMPAVESAHRDLLVTKNVNSAFYGTPDLHAWLQAENIHSMVICGIQTNMCVETTARMGGNLGYSVTVVLDATRTFDLSTDTVEFGALSLTADELMKATALNLHAGGFATITTTLSLVERLTTAGMGAAEYPYLS